MTRANQALKRDRADRGDLAGMQKYDFSCFELDCA